MSIIPWSPTSMMLTQRCSFICFRPSISWPTILSMSLRGLLSWKTAEETRTARCVPPPQRHASLRTVAPVTHVCAHGSHLVSIGVWLLRVHGINIRPGRRAIPWCQYHMHTVDTMLQDQDITLVSCKQTFKLLQLHTQLSHILPELLIEFNFI